MGGVVKTVVGIAVTALGVVTGNPALIISGIGLTVGGAKEVLSGKPKVGEINAASQDRLFINIAPDAARKMVFGRTAMGTDVRYQAPTGTNQEYHDQIIAVASHKATAIEEIWEENEQVWTSGGGVASSRTGFLTVATVLEGSDSNEIDVDSTWCAAEGRRLTGCAYVHIRRKMTGTAGKADSPYANGIPSRITIVGKGLPFYDPRKDTSAGGSGSQDYDDQSTWAWEVSSNGAGRNAALALLNYLIGWRINGKLAVGRGIPRDRIDLDSFITAANLCDESVSLAAGGTEKRYRYDNVHAEDEDGDSVIRAMLLAMNASLEDDGGPLTLRVAHDDLADPVMHIDTADLVAPFESKPFLHLEQARNIVRGRYIDASDEGLYQATDSPQIAIASVDGIDRILSLEAAGVQSGTQHQRLMKQALQRLQYQWTLRLVLNAKGYALKRGDVVTVTLAPLAHLSVTDKLFRVVERGIPFDGRVPIFLREEHEDLYAWDEDESPPVVPASPIPFDHLNDPVIGGISDASGLVDGPPELTITYDYLGAADPALPRTEYYRLLRNGVLQTSGITWTYTVLTGTVNGYNSASGAQSLSGSGEVGFAISSFGSDTATVELTAVQGSLTAKKAIRLNKKLADPPTSTGGSGPVTIASKSSGFTNVANTTFGDKTGWMTGTVPSGRTAVAINLLLNFNPAIASPDGTWNVEVKVQRDVAGTPTDIGSTANSDPDPAVEVESGIYSLLSTGGLTATINDTGLSGATTYSWRVMARLTSGSKSISITGSVSIVA